jgi:hypothetical protein
MALNSSNTLPQQPFNTGPNVAYYVKEEVDNIAAPLIQSAADFTAHAADNSIHVTLSDKTAWNNKVTSVNGQTGVVLLTMADIPNPNPADPPLITIINNIQNDITTINNTINTIQGDLTALTVRVTVNEGAITTLQTNMTTVQGQIVAINLTVSAIDTRLTAAETDLSAHIGNTVIHVTAADKLAWNTTTSDFNLHSADLNIHVTAADKVAWNGAVTLLNAHVVDNTIHITAAERAAWNLVIIDFAAHAANGAIHVTAAQKIVWDNVVADFNTHATDTTIHVTTADKASWNAMTPLSTFNLHDTNTTRHITATERATWNAKLDASDILGKQDVTNLVTAWQSVPDNTHYPSEKLVDDRFNVIEAMVQGSQYMGMLDYGADTLATLLTITGMVDGNTGGAQAEQLTFVFTTTQPTSGTYYPSNDNTGWWVEQAHGNDKVGQWYNIASWYGTWKGQSFTGNASATITCSDAALHIWDLIVTESTPVDGVTIGQINGKNAVLDGAITTPKLADNAVTTVKIYDGAITTAKLADKAVTTLKIADAAVNVTQLADGAVTTLKILDANVTTAKLADGSVTTDKLAIDAVTTIKILDANVTTAKLADNAVTAAKMAAGAAADNIGILDITHGGTGSNVKNFVDLTTNQSINGTKAFTTSPTVPQKSAAAQNLDTEIATEAQVYNIEQDVVHKAGAEIITGIKTFATGAEPVLPSKTAAAVNDGTKPATEAQVYSVNNNAVHKTGNESVAGTKTFSTSPVVPSKTTMPTTSGTILATEAQVVAAVDDLDARVQDQLTVILGELFIGIAATQAALTSAPFSTAAIGCIAYVTLHATTNSPALVRKTASSTWTVFQTWPIVGMSATPPSTAPNGSIWIIP